MKLSHALLKGLNSYTAWNFESEQESVLEKATIIILIDKAKHRHSKENILNSSGFL